MSLEKPYEKFINLLEDEKELELIIPVLTEEEITQKYNRGEFRIVTEQARYPLATLSAVFERTELRPEYQRKLVWDEERKSRLIESFIINVPIPPVFLYEVEYAKYEIMDGLQRVSTIIDFFDNKFKLKGLELWEELNGKSYEELPKDLQDGIRRRYLSATILLKETSKTKEEESMMKRFVFDRLNTGGVKLENQEVRNALYTSKFNDLIVKIGTENTLLNKLWGGFSDNQVSRMYAEELVLRFYSYLSATKLNLSIGTKRILDSYAEKAVSYTEEDVASLEKIYTETLRVAQTLFGDNAFTSPENSRTEKQLYDAIMLACATLILEGEITEHISLPNLEEEKISIIKENSNIFNGRMTSISSTNEKIQKIYELVKTNIEVQND